MVKKYFSFTALLLFVNFSLLAQSAADTTSSGGMNGFMRSNDKIYVVMTVCITILVVLFLYLIRIDSKVSKKERLS